MSQENEKPRPASDLAKSIQNAMVGLVATVIIGAFTGFMQLQKMETRFATFEAQTEHRMSILEQKTSTLQSEQNALRIEIINELSEIRILIEQQNNKRR